MLSILTLFSRWVEKLKNHTGVHRRARGAERRPERGAQATNGGRSGAPRARRCAPVWFLNFTTHRENKVNILSKKLRDTQTNPRYSAKNNVAIRMIATFMPSKSFDIFTSNISYLFQEQITINIKYKLI